MSDKIESQTFSDPLADPLNVNRREMMATSAAATAGLAYSNVALSSAVAQNPKAAIIDIVKRFADVVKKYRSPTGYVYDWQESSAPWGSFTFEEFLKHGKTQIQNSMRFVAAELKATQQLEAILSLPNGDQAWDDSIGLLMQMGREMEDCRPTDPYRLEQLQVDDAKKQGIIKIVARSVMRIAEKYRDTLLEPFGLGKMEAEEVAYNTMSHLSWGNVERCSEAHTQWLERSAEDLAGRVLIEGERHKIPEQELTPVLEHMCNYLLSEAREHLMSVSSEFAENIISTMKKRFDYGIKNTLEGRQRRKKLERKEEDKADNHREVEKGRPSVKTRHASDGITAMLGNIEAAKDHPFAQRIQERSSLKDAKIR